MTALEDNLVQENVTHADALLRSNEVYFQNFINRPFFKMIEGGLLNKDKEKKAIFFNYMQIFADYFQTMMQMRQANCCDEKFRPIFLKHFFDELGHDDLFRQRDKITGAWDSILVAVSTWFVHQMQVLDNIEKTVVMHLVLEKGGDFYHTLGNQALTQHVQSNYYEAHAELDDGHASMINDLLPGYPEFTYQRLHRLLKESWSMLYTMVDRVHELVMKEPHESPRHKTSRE